MGEPVQRSAPGATGVGVGVSGWVCMGVWVCGSVSVCVCVTVGVCGALACEAGRCVQVLSSRASVCTYGLCKYVPALMGCVPCVLCVYVSLCVCVHMCVRVFTVLFLSFVSA